uniref:U1-type domain-containing protein n=1 Tax=Physcomitrium patens TaxID=3218 RepID=A0A7I4BZB5_PHYPA
MRENLARAVVRDLRHQGHEHVVLRRDGVTAVLYCSLCDTRCYNEAALWDHLNGKSHSRHYESVRAKGEAWGKQAKREFVDVDADDDSWATTATGARERWDAGNKGSTLSDEESCLEGEFEGHGVSATSSTTSLKWIGSGELLLKTKATGSAYVEASWFFWQGMYKLTAKNWNKSGGPSGIEYALVVFPYSDGIGRGGNWPSLSRSGTKGSRVLESINLRRGHKMSRKVPGNYRFKTQVSREIIASTGTSPSTARHKALSPLTLTIRTNPTKLVTPEVLESDGDPAKSGVENDGPITTYRRIWKQKQVKNPDRICFICRQKLLPIQDVAALVNVKSGQMICGSRNRRGVYEWVMELIEARKAYMEDHGNPLGLLFVKPANSKSPGVVQSRGFIHCYSARGYPDLMANAMSREVESRK